MAKFVEQHHVVMASVPATDKFAGTLNTTAVHMKNYRRGAAVVLKGAGDTGTTKLTLEACSASNGTGAEAIPFKKSVCTTGDAFSALADVPAAGFDTTAGANQMYVLEYEAQSLPEGKPWVRVTGVEQTDSPCAGAVIFILSNPGYVSEILPSALS